MSNQTNLEAFSIPMSWNWSEVCPDGLKPWATDNKDLSLCFQQICLQIPAFIILSILSGYYYGHYNLTRIKRNSTQQWSIMVRSLVTIVLAVLPVTKILYLMNNDALIWPVDITLSCIEFFAWFVHLGYLHMLQKRGTLSQRGPLSFSVLWSVLFILYGIWLRSNYNSNRQLEWPIIKLSLIVVYGTTLLPKGQSVFVHRTLDINNERRSLLSHSYIRFQDDIEEQFIIGAAHDNQSFLAKLIFYWVHPLIAKGVAGMLRTNDDLFDLPECLSPRIGGRLQMAIVRTKTLFKALHKCFGMEFYSVGVLRLISDISSFAGPLLLNGLLSQTPKDTDETDYKPYLYAGGLFLSSLISALAGTHFNWRMSLVSMKMRMGIVTAIYRKTMKAKGLQEGPDVLNLMSNDTDRIVNSCISFHSFWSIPFQLFTTLYLLYTQLGSAFIAGVIFAAALIPLNRWISVQIGRLSQSLMTAKDARIGISREALAGAKQIKLNAWEDVFINKIEELRTNEVVFLSKRKYLDALCVYFWATTPVLMCLLTFGVSVLIGNPLTAATTFTSVALLNMLIGPLNAFPWVLNGLIEAWVSLKRVQILINIEDINYATYYSPIIKRNTNNQLLEEEQQSLVIEIDKATFEFEQTRDRSTRDLEDQSVVDFRLRSISMQVRAGELVCIEGPVGGGKSTLLLAMVGNLRCVAGKIAIENGDKGFGYVSQNPWLQRGTVRDNVLWGNLYDEVRYKTVLHACALEEDLLVLGGDRCGIGEAGHTLSGGQKVRVALARAIYQDKDIYLLDNVLSALDAHVALHIIKYCIFGILKSKTRIVVTEHVSLLTRANKMFHVENGKMVQKSISEVEIENDNLDLLDNNKPEAFVSFAMKNQDDSGDQQSVDSVMMEETREKGTLAKRVFSAYFRAMTFPMAFCVLLFVLLMQASKNLTDLWLTYWVSSTTNSSNSSLPPDFDFISASTHFYLPIYAVLAVINSVLTLVRSFLFAYAGIKAAKFIHTKLLNNVFHTKMEFFDVTPLGRILNRFSSDTYTIDDTLPFILNILLAQLFGLIGSIFISIYALPWITLLIVPMVPVYLSIQNQYRHASRDIKRLSSNAMSPLYAHFTETIQGMVTIRAMRESNRFCQEFGVKLEESIKAQMTSAAASQWLGLRLQFLGCLLVGGCGVIAATTSAHTSTPSLVGLAISYALSITGLLSGVLNALAETEQELIAVERVNQYCELQPEPNAEGSIDPPFGWPCQGLINFQNVEMSYREHLTPSLKNLTLEIQPCERVGIVGRTGAGKTSILSALLRVSSHMKLGQVSIDCINIATLPLRSLRSRIAVVEQNPFLFAGRIRDNLDPRGLHLDSEIWKALNSCLATVIVQSLGGLNAQLESGGGNLSSGQKQLLCLARALLKNSKIVLIDEGTANLDLDSAKAIQIVLKKAFKSSTLILIAHRLDGLQYCNRIVVMREGVIVEEGEPSQLAADSKSYFHQMVQEQQNKDY